jgi:hypothetical protein
LQDFCFIPAGQNDNGSKAPCPLKCPLFFHEKVTQRKNTIFPVESSPSGVNELQNLFAQIECMIIMIMLGVGGMERSSLSMSV